MTSQCQHCQSTLDSDATECPACGKSAKPTTDARIVPILSRRLLKKRKKKQQDAKSKRSPVSVPESVQALAELSNLDDQGPDSSGQGNAPDGSRESKPGNPRFKTDESVPESQIADAIYDQQLTALLQAAMEEIEAEQFEDAAERLDTAIVDAPDRRLPDCYALRGYLRLKAKDFGRSESDCTQALEGNPLNTQVLAWRAAARGEQNKWRLAFDDLHAAHKVAAIMPTAVEDNSQASHGRKIYRQLMTDYSLTARKYFQGIIRTSESNPGLLAPEVFYERGWMYRRLGDLKKARRDFRQTLKLDPKHTWAAAGLAAILVKDSGQGGTNEPPRVVPGSKLEAKIQRLCQIAMPGDPPCQRIALSALTRLYHRQHASAQKTAVVERLLKLAAAVPDQQLKIGELLNEVDEPLHAIELLSPLLAKNRRIHDAWRIRGDANYLIRDDDRAVADYSEYLAAFPNDIKLIIQRARAEWRSGNEDVAIDDLDHALSLDKTRADAWLLRGRICLAADKVDQAIANCQTVTRLDNENAAAYATLGEAWKQMGDLQRSAEVYGRSIDFADSDADRANYFYQRGMRWYELADYKKAALDFSSSLQHRPSHAGTLIWSATSQARLENWAVAIENLHHAISRHPASASQYRVLGKPVAEKAIKHFNVQLKRDNKDTTLILRRGMAHQFLGNLQQASNDYSEALRQEPQNMPALLLLGESLTQAGDTTAARESLDRAVELDPKSHWAFYCRSVAWIKEANTSLALADIRKAIKLSPGEAIYHTLAAQLASQSGDRKRQRDALNQSILNAPTNWYLYQQRGSAWLAAHEPRLAIRDFSQALDLDTSQASVRVQRGQAFLKSGHFAAAVADFETAVSLNPKLPKGWTGWAAALAAFDRHEDALISLTRAMHRFTVPTELAELIFARGKIFHQMGRLGPAVIDFSGVVDLLDSHPDKQSSALLARAIALAQLDQLPEAQADFESVQLPGKKSQADVRAALDWIQNPSRVRPAFLNPPDRLIRPTRPPECSIPEPHWLPSKVYPPASPHEAWVVRLSNDREYGPVRFDILLEWIREGRTDADTKLLRSTWAKWQPIDRVFPGPTSASDKKPGTDDTAANTESFPQIKI